MRKREAILNWNMERACAKRKNGTRKKTYLQKNSTILFGIYFLIKCRRLSIAAGKSAKRETIRWKTFSQHNFTVLHWTCTTYSTFDI